MPTGVRIPPGAHKILGPDAKAFGLLDFTARKGFERRTKRSEGVRAGATYERSELVS